MITTKDNEAVVDENATIAVEASMPSTDIETMPPTMAEEVVKADLVTDKNVSVGSPHPVLDVGPTKINLQPKLTMPKKGRAGTQPKYIKAEFFGEKNFFIGESPYDHAKIRRLIFWTTHQVNFYA